MGLKDFNQWTKKSENQGKYCNGIQKGLDFYHLGELLGMFWGGNLLFVGTVDQTLILMANHLNLILPLLNSGL